MTLRSLAGYLAIGFAGVALGQAGTGTPAGSTAGAKAPAATAPAEASPVKAAPTKAAKGLQLYSLDPTTQADPFPAIDPRNFTADSPSASTVDSYLRSMLGYDSKRIWRVVSIQKTIAPGVSRVAALVSERVPGAKVMTAVFYVLPDGKHLIAPDASGVNPFGAEPFAEARAMLRARADGPSLGAAAKDLMLVEFSDAQCPHCKEALATMARLTADFPKARVVYQSLPLTQIHPADFQAASYGVCVAAKGTDAFLTFTRAVSDTQSALTPDTTEVTLKNAATKAGQDPSAIAACAATAATRDAVNASVKLATDLGIDQTPILSVNGRTLPLTTVPYETLKLLIVYQAELDGVSAAAVSPNATGLMLDGK